MPEKQKIPIQKESGFSVVPPGIEPGTQGFSVINWNIYFWLIASYIATYPYSMVKTVDKTKSVFWLILKLVIP